MKLQQIWRVTEVRNSLLFVFALLVIFRVAAHIPVPGLDASALTSFFQNNQFAGLLNIFSGGTLENFSIVALGVGPYITASIIFQLLAMIVPKLEEMQKEEAGRQKINSWTRWLSVPLAAFQGYAMVLLLRQQAPTVFNDLSIETIFIALLSMTAGTIFVMWLGELISEKHVGNGVSIMIFAGIIAGLPQFFQRSLAIYDRSQIITMILFVVITIITIIGVVIMHEAQRNIPIQYARGGRISRLAGGVANHLPLKVNMAGVIPIIFAISIILFPRVFAQFFSGAKSVWLSQAAQFTMTMFDNQLVYGIVYFLLVFFFSYFYTSVVFHPDRVAENLQMQGGFIPGIRPGKSTAEYLSFVSNRILLAGGLFLAVIAVLPLGLQSFTGNASLVIGGTSILIVVNVIIETVKQIEAQLTMREYEL